MQRRALLIGKVAQFAARIFKVFGLIGDGELEWSTSSGGAGGATSATSTASIEPYVALLAKFRSTVRSTVTAAHSLFVRRLMIAAEIKVVAAAGAKSTPEQQRAALDELLKQVFVDDVCVFVCLFVAHARRAPSATCCATKRCRRSACVSKTTRRSASQEGIVCWSLNASSLAVSRRVQARRRRRTDEGAGGGACLEYAMCFSNVEDETRLV